MEIAMASNALKPQVHGIFDPATWTVTYVVYEKEGGPCAIIDSVLDYDPKSGRTRTDSADKVIAFVKEKNLQVAWILETHAHADHLTAAPMVGRLSVITSPRSRQSSRAFSILKRRSRQTVGSSTT